MKTIIGIDPGKSGGVAWITGREAFCRNMPETPQELVHLISSLPDPGAAVAYVEQVHSGIFRQNDDDDTDGEEPRKMGVKSAFTFGHGYGVILGVLAAFGIRIELVSPGKWQRAMGCLTKGDKKVSKAAALRLFPNLKVTLKTADALLIAEYGARIERMMA